MRALIVAAMVCWSGTVCASGQPPQPVGQQAVDAKPANANPENESQAAAAEQRGSENAPLVVRPDATTAKQRQDEAAKDQDERRKETSSSQWIGWATAAILVVQAFFFWLQAKRLRET